MNHFKRIIGLVAACIGAFAGAMNQEKKTPPPSPVKKVSPLKTPRAGVHPSKWSAKLLSTTQDIIADSLLDEINATPQGGYIGIDNIYLTDKKIIKALIAASERGVRIVIDAGRGVKKETIEQFRKAGITVNKLNNLHVKRYLISHRDPDLGHWDLEGLEHTHVFAGSYNSSQIAQYHKEVMEHVVDDVDYFRDHFMNLNASSEGSELGEKDVLDVTPAKRMVTNSQGIDSLRSKAKRVNKLIESEDMNDCIDITSMTFDSKEITEAIESLMAKREKNPPTMRLFLDSSAAKHTDLLDRLVKSGASVYIFNYDRTKKTFGKFPQLQHAKTIIRRCNDEYLTINSTGNLTGNSNREINVDAYHPNDPKLYNAIKKLNDELATECDEYVPTR